MAKQIWRGRGRTPGNMHAYKDRRGLEYLARLAVKNEVDTNKFFNCILEAWNNEDSECDSLVISCRNRTNDSAIFLFTNGRKVLAQFPISTTILKGKNPLERYIRMISDRASTAIKVENPKIEDLKAGMKKVSLKARVLDVPKYKVVYTRFGTTAYVSNAIIEDETGSMRISLWNQQINKVHKGDVINIKNSRVTRFSGELQLTLGRSGSLSVIE